MTTTRPFRFGAQVGSPGSAAEYRALARQIEDLGYSTLSMADHFDGAMAPVPTLAVVAEATTTLRIATMVFCNDFRHPAVLARDAATLDVLSNGRFELGLGAGWQRSDYDQTGITLDPAGERIDRLAEAAQIIKALMADETASFRGEYYTITELDGLPKPVQLPHPPLMMGGGGPKMLRTAARHATIVGINPDLRAGVIDHRAGPSATLDRTRQKLGWIRAAAGDRFETLELQARVHVAEITDDADALAQAMAGPLGISPNEALQTPHALVGTADEIEEKLVQLRAELGLSYFTWSAERAVAMAPIVERLTGT